MAWLLLLVTGLLCVLVVMVAVLALRVRRLERGLAQDSSRYGNWLPNEPADRQFPYLDAPGRPEAPVSEHEHVITQLGAEVDETVVEAEPVPVVEPTLFVDIVLRETVVQTAGLVHGLRRALSAENRNRIRFEMRREIKRSRKQRRADLREARREWEARQRASVVLEDTAA